jgi:DNA-directed RNA polymerase specialized sigma24 family protein
MPDGTPDFGFSSDLPFASTPTPDPALIAAINALTKEDFSKLHVCAVALFYRIRHLAPDRNPNDLLNEAMVRSLDGVRHWKPDKVEFIRYLIGCMSSIVDHWRKQYLKLPPFAPFDENATPSRSRFTDPLHSRIEHAALRAHFQGDDEAWNVLNLRMEGCTPAEIREELNLSLHAYHAAAKRGRRKGQAWAFEQLKIARINGKGTTWLRSKNEP